MVNEILLKKIEKNLTERGILNDDTYSEIKLGVEKLSEIRMNIDTIVIELKRVILDNSIHLLQDRVMNQNINGVIEILDNTKNVVDFYGYLEKKEELIKEYSKYKLLYEDNYPELKEIKDSLALKDEELINIVREIISNYNVVS
jgi:hypothetical protein